jgi:sodium/potassium-transporting ATPase subunit alpha
MRLVSLFFFFFFSSIQNLYLFIFLIKKKKPTSYITIVFLQYGGLLAVRNRRVSIINSNPLWGPRRNLAVPAGMLATALIGVTNLYGPGLQKVFATTPIPSKYWGIPFGFALGILIMDEMRKLIVRTYPKVCVCSFM